MFMASKKDIMEYDEVYTKRTLILVLRYKKRIILSEAGSKNKVANI
jgi:hypothetical protein